MSIFLFTYHPAFISTKIKVKAKIICKKVSVHNSHAKLDIIVDNAIMILFFLKIHAKFFFYLPFEVNYAYSANIRNRPIVYFAVNQIIR